MPVVPRCAGGAAPFRAPLLPAAWDEEEGGVDGLFSSLDGDEFWEGVFQLLYHQHGGSGLALTMTEIMELELDRMRWLLERLGEQREKEAHEMEKAAQRSRRK